MKPRKNKRAEVRDDTDDDAWINVLNDAQNNIVASVCDTVGNGVVNIVWNRIWFSVHDLLEEDNGARE